MSIVFKCLASALAVVLAFGGVVLLDIDRASAHDQLVSSSPSANEALSGAPERVELVYSGEIMTIGAAVLVVDSAGKSWTVGDPIIDRSTVASRLESGPPVGVYEIRWRVVSRDGHPLTGVVPFTIGDATPVEVPTNGKRTTPATADPSPAADKATGVALPPAIRTILIGAGGAAAALGATWMVLHLKRRRSSS